MNQLALFDSYGGALVADYSHKAQGLTVVSGPRGFAECGVFIAMPLAEAFQLYDRAGMLAVRVSDNAAGAIYEGRLEDVNIVSDGVKARALGYARAFADLPYTAMWSVTQLDSFEPIWLASAVLGPTPNRKFVIDAATGQVNIGLVKNSLYAAGERGQLQYTIPNGSSRQIAGVACDYEFLASANVTLRISRWTVSATYPYFTFAANVTSIVGTGALQRGSIFTGTGAADVLSFGLETAAHNYAGETGAEYAKISNIRIVSDISNLISTTLTVARTNGSPVTVTVGSTAGMYVGQRLILIGGGNSESVVVLSIPTGTTFTANVANAPGGGYPIGTLVRAFVVEADQIAADLVAMVTATNSTQLSTSVALIQSPGIDLLDQVYEDRAMDDLLDELAGLGDASGRQWEWGVYERQMLYLRPQSSASRAWSIDLSDIDIDRTIDQLTNSVYAVYQNADDVTQRTAAATDSASVARYGLTRRAALAVDTTNATIAATHRDTALVDGATPPVRSAIQLTQVYDATGARWPLWYVRAGDTLTIRNLPPTLSTAIDRVRSFRLTRAEYHADDDTLAVEPDVPRPTLDSLLARLALGQTP